jgi:3-oxoacyl-[acyl-carrier protein] reductase
MATPWLHKSFSVSDARLTMKTSNSKVAIVTGASRGIGAAIARRLGTDGFTVVVNYAGSAEAAESLVREIENVGGRALAVKADVSDPVAVARLFDTAEKEFGGVDVLVNNAGVMLLSPIAEASDELIDRQIAINLKGVLNGMREAAKRLRNSGRIISFSSSVVGLYQPTYARLCRDQGGCRSHDPRVIKRVARPEHNG